MLDPLPLVKIISRGIGGAGTNKHIAGAARIAIILLAFSAQQQAKQTQTIIVQLAEISRHMADDDTRISYLENVINVAYNTALEHQPLKTRGTK